MVKLMPLSAHPPVSIIVPSYNQGRFIGETIESILSQSYRPVEILVIDGSSTDETLDVLKSFGNAPELTWWSEPDSGVVEAVNKGFEHARGEIAGIQSSDDCYLPDAVATAVEYMRTHPGAGLVHGDVLKIDTNGHELSRTHLPSFTLERLLSCRTWIPQPSTFFRLDLARALGGWREELPYAPDTDLWLRMAFRAEVKKLDVVMAKRRMHEQQRDKEGAKVIRDYRRMIDSCENLKAAPRRLKKAAAAGRVLIANRYGYEDSYWVKFRRQWEALMIYPPLLGSLSFSSFVPGWYPVRMYASRLKRAVLSPSESNADPKEI